MYRYASIDIGSNSIRLLVAEAAEDGSLRDLVSARQVVRLGASVFREGKLSQAAIAEACGVLGGMAAEFRRHDVAGIRAVGTAALRDASNRTEFLDRAAEALGVPVEIISGLEEARLVNRGVQARWPQGRRKVLITDIGGGSAELIYSDSGHVSEAFSKPLGAVRMTEMFLKSDPPQPRELVRMEKYVEERFAPAVERLRGIKMERLIVTSATGAAAVCAANNIRRQRREHADRLAATARQIRELYAELGSQPIETRRKMVGIGPRRAEIVVAGIGVLNYLIGALEMPRVYYSAAGVRDGIVADLIHRKVGREPDRLDGDQRRLALTMARRYGLSGPHVKQVARLAGMLFEALHPVHALPPGDGRILEAAAYLYNIGHYVNESRHHHHSYYLVMNSDLSGFTDRERAMIANLCRYHRKGLPQSTHVEMQPLDDAARRTVTLLAPLLRLAVALDQSQEQLVARVTAATGEPAVQIRVHSRRDCDLELYYADQTAQVFRQVFNRDLRVTLDRSSNRTEPTASKPVAA